MAPGRTNGLYVVVVGEGVRVPFLRGGGNPAVYPPASESDSELIHSGEVKREEVGKARKETPAMGMRERAVQIHA